MTQDRHTPHPTVPHAARRSTLELFLLSDFGRLNPERARELAYCDQPPHQPTRQPHPAGDDE